MRAWDCGYHPAWRYRRIQEKIKKFGLKLQDATIIQPTASPRFNAYAQQYYEMRKSKGLTLEQAQERMQDSTYFGTMMVQIGDATAWFPAL